MNIGVAHVTAAEGGGADRYIRDLAAGVDARHWIWHVGPEVLEDVARQRFFRAPDAAQAARWLEGAGIALLHLHGVGASCLAVRDRLAAAAGHRPQVVTLHDVGFCAPRAFAGDAAIDAATVARSAEALRHADAVVVPSGYIGDLVAEHVPGLRTLARIEPGIEPAIDPDRAPEVDEAFAKQAQRRRIAVAGAVGPHKGAGLLASIAAALAPLDATLVVIGYTGDQLLPGWAAPNLYVHGPYGDGMLEDWLDAYAAELVLFVNRMPESFSYTLSEAWAARRAVIVPDEGALGERVARHGGGWRLAPGFEAAEVAALVARLATPEGMRERATVESALDGDDPSRVPALSRMNEQFEALYAELLRQARPAAGVTPAGAMDPADEAAGLAPLVLANLDGRVFRAELVRLARELDGLRTWSAKQDADIAELKGAIESLADENRKLRDTRDAFELLPDFVKRQLYRRAFRGRD